MRKFLVAAILLAASPLTALAQTPAKDAVVAKVGGDDVKQSEVDAMLEAYGERLREFPEGERREIALDRVIDMHLIARAARAEKLQNDPEVKRQVAAAERAVLQDVFIGKLVERETSEKALRERFKREFWDGKGIREVRVRHILTYTEGKAENLIKELEKGADFAKLARENSVDNRTADKGGEIGWVEEDAVAESFYKTARWIKVGAVADKPVETGHGWHVIKVDEERFRKGPSFEDARKALAEDAVEDSVTDLLVRMRDDVKIEKLGSTKVGDGDRKPAPKPETKNDSKSN